MGVDISDLIKPRAIEIISLAGKKIAFDAYNMIYQFLSTIRQRDGTPLMDSNGNVTSHLSGIFYRTSKLLENGISPIYVFDGKPPTFKAVTKERAQRKEIAQKKYEKALGEGDLVSARKYAQQTSKLTKNMVEETKELLGHMGIPFVQAPSEGEAQIAHMCKKGDVWSAASQDYDTVLFGSPKLIRNLNISGRRKVTGREFYQKIDTEMIELKEVLSSLGISREKLIALGILIGTDYNPKGIRGIGPKKALEIVRKDNYLDEIKKLDWSFDMSFEDIHAWFMNPDVIDEYSLSRGNLDKENTKEFLCEKHDFSEVRVNNVFERIESIKTTQIGLDSFFNLQ